MRQQCGRGEVVVVVQLWCQLRMLRTTVTAWPRVSATRRDTRRQRGAGRSGGHSAVTTDPRHGRRPSVKTELYHWSDAWRWSNSDFKQIIIGLIVGIGAGRWPGRLYTHTELFVICVCYPRYKQHLQQSTRLTLNCECKIKFVVVKCKWFQFNYCEKFATLIINLSFKSESTDKKINGGNRS